MDRFDRKLLRLQGFNYSSPGFYFVTIVTKWREKWFGEIKDDEMLLNDCGRFAKNMWKDIPKHFCDVVNHEFIIMPNHVHGIVEICDDLKTIGTAVGKNVGGFVGAAELVLRLSKDVQPLRNGNIGHDRTKMKLSKIIHGFKSSVTREIRKTKLGNEFMWQRSFYDRIIRNEDEYLKISEYIQNNIYGWEKDDLR